MKLKEIILFGSVALGALLGPTIVRDPVGSYAIGPQAQAAEDRRIIVRNHTKKRIVALYASPIDQKDWTFNMLTTVGHPIYANDEIVADIDDGTGYCRYDLKAVDAAGRVAIHMDANVCVALTWDIYP